MKLKELQYWAESGTEILFGTSSIPFNSFQWILWHCMYDIFLPQQQPTPETQKN